MKNNLHSERLILNGVELAPAECPAFQTALAGELARLLAKRGVEPSLAGENSVAINGDGDPIRLRNQAAGSMYGGIGK